MKTNVNLTSEERAFLVDFISAKSAVKSELTELIMTAPEVFPKSILAEKSIFSMKKMMLDIVNNVKPAQKVENKPEINFESMAAAIRQICQNVNLTPENRVKLIDALLNNQTENKPAPKVENKPVKNAPKVAKKQAKGMPKKTEIMNAIALSGAWFTIQDLIDAVNEYYPTEEPSNKLGAGAFVAQTKPLMQKHDVQIKVKNGVKMYRVAA